MSKLSKTQRWLQLVNDNTEILIHACWAPKFVPFMLHKASLQKQHVTTTKAKKMFPLWFNHTSLAYPSKKDKTSTLTFYILINSF